MTEWEMKEQFARLCDNFSRNFNEATCEAWFKEMSFLKYNIFEDAITAVIKNHEGTFPKPGTVFRFYNEILAEKEKKNNTNKTFFDDETIKAMPALDGIYAKAIKLQLQSQITLKQNFHVNQMIEKVKKQVSDGELTKEKGIEKLEGLLKELVARKEGWRND